MLSTVGPPEGAQLLGMFGTQPSPLGLVLSILMHGVVSKHSSKVALSHQSPNTLSSLLPQFSQNDKRSSPQYSWGYLQTIVLPTVGPPKGFQLLQTKVKYFADPSSCYQAYRIRQRLLLYIQLYKVYNNLSTNIHIQLIRTIN